MVFFSAILALIVVGPIFIGPQTLTESGTPILLSTKAYSDAPSSWTYGVSGCMERITSLTKVTSGNILLSLYECNDVSGSQDAPFIKNSLLELDSQFNTVWSTSWNTTSGNIYTVVQDSSNNLYVSGSYTLALESCLLY